MDLNKIKLRAYVDYRVGNVIKIKGKFGFRVTVIFDDMEEKESQHSGFAKKEEAEKERNHVIAQLHDKKYVVYKNIKVEELLTYWLENIIRSKEGVSACTYNTYKNCIEKHIIPELGKLTLVKLNQGHISKLYKKLVEKYSSIPRIAKPILNTPSSIFSEQNYFAARRQEPSLQETALNHSTHLRFFSSTHKFYKLTGSNRNNFHRIFGSHRVDSCLFLDQLFQSTKESSSSGQNNSSIQNIR